jgi:hypothetical protein
VISLQVDKLVAQAVGVELTESEHISILADETVAAKLAKNEKIEWPAGDGDDEVVSKADYPAEIWSAAETRWNAMNKEERDQHEADRRKNLEARLAIARQQIKEQAFQSSFGPYDLLWFGLAAMTAFRVGRGTQENHPVPDPATSPGDSASGSPPVA